MNILSLFDGMSCGMIALERAGVKVNSYYAAEIDKYATKVSEENYPDIVRLGDVTNWRDWNIDWGSIDLVLGGFPCQAWSMAGKQLGDKDERGMLFWTMLDIIKEVRKHNPNADFLIENVKMKKEFEQYITHHTKQALGIVHKILINSALVSAQNRNRYYWTSWENEQPEDKKIILTDVIEDNADERFYVKPHKDYVDGNQLNPNYKSQANTIHDTNKKCPAVCAGTHGYSMGYIIIQKGQGNNLGGVRGINGKTPMLSASSWEHNNHLSDGTFFRRLTPVEFERLQTVPDDYTASVSNTQRYKMLGNGWTVDVIAHLLRRAKAR